MPEALEPGETLIAEWRPSFARFLGKLGFLSGVTAVILGVLFFGVSPLTWLIVLPISALVYLFAFDDHREWLRRRHDRWRLTTRRLILETPDAEGSPAFVPLNQIRGVRRWMWWAVFVDLANGQTTQISFPAAPGRLRAQILAARDGAVHG